MLPYFNLAHGYVLDDLMSLHNYQLTVMIQTAIWYRASYIVIVVTINNYFNFPIQIDKVENTRQQTKVKIRPTV